MERVQMICMPYQIAAISSLSTALLSTLLRSHGVEVTESYVHFNFARIVGADLYRQVTDGDTERGLLGELFFAEALYGPSSNPRLAPMFGPPETRHERRALFLEECLRSWESARASVVGFTTSFNQLLPSLWLAREIKSRWPHVRIVMGGSACTGEMGLALRDAYPYIDCVVSGNGERALSGLATGTEPFPGDRLLVDNEPVNLNEIPIPDYEAFIQQAGDNGRSHSNLMLSYETSRGCWWGEKHHCTFCGINGAQMRFNAKSSDRAYAEILELWRRYRLHLFSTDSILDREHLKTCLPRLAAHPDRPFLFYEVKANLKPYEVKQLHDANIRHIQPGIESLSSPVLGLLRKGVRMLQNLSLLKSCREWNIRVSWNLLYGVPEETQADYDEQIALMARIPQLTPPTSMSRVRIDRFSPYFNRFRDFGWTSIRPLTLYSELHRGLPDALVEGMAYHFEGIGGCTPVAQYERPLFDAFQLWHERHKRGDGLFWDDDLGLFEVSEGRVFSYQRSAELDEIFQLTREPASIARVRSRVSFGDADWQALIDNGVLVEEGNQVMNLAVCLNPGAAVSEDAESAFHILETM